jgi:flagellar biosynthesis/type III secretory pathway M-ring protein FliF/YscJ
VLGLLFFILRMMSNVRNASKESWKTILKPVSEVASLQGDYKDAAMQLQSDLSSALDKLANKDHQHHPLVENKDVVLQLSSRSQHATASEDEQRQRIVTRLAEENPATVAEIIQIWLNESKKS